MEHFEEVRTKSGVQLGPLRGEIRERSRPRRQIPLPALVCTHSLIRTASKFVSSEPPWHVAEEHLNQIDFTDVNYEDTDIMHKVIYPSEEFK